MSHHGVETPEWLGVCMSPDAHFLEVQHICNLCCALVLSPPMMLLASESHGSSFQSRTLSAIVGIAIIGMAALCSFTLAYQQGQTGRIALIGYSEVPISYIMQVFVFGTTLKLVPLAGAVLIVLSAAMSTMEKQTGNRVPPLAPPSPNL